MRTFALLVLAALAPAVALAQSAGEVERCFQNPAVCGQGGGQAGGGATPAPSGGPPVAATRPAAPAPDYTTVLQSAEPDRKRIQESLRTLDKYNGPIDGDLQSEATTKAITDWQKAHSLPPAGKLTPQEAQQLNAEATKTPIKRIEPPTQTATAPSTAPSQSNADALKALQARLAERRKAAEPKAVAAMASLARDLNAYIAADGKGVAGEQFPTFAKWYADNKAAGRAIASVVLEVEDFGDIKAGQAAFAQATFLPKQREGSERQCLVFTWVEGNPRKNTETFSCDDVAGVEKWKTEQTLKSAWR